MIFNSSYHCIALEFTFKLGPYKMHLIESAKIIPLTTLVSNHWRKRHSSTYYWLRLQHRQWHQQHVTELAVGVTMKRSWRRDVALSTCTECYARILYMRVQNSGITYNKERQILILQEKQYCRNSVWIDCRKYFDYHNISFEKLHFSTSFVVKSIM